MPKKTVCVDEFKVCVKVTCVREKITKKCKTTHYFNREGATRKKPLKPCPSGCLRPKAFSCQEVDPCDQLCQGACDD